jgi:hypothetical protein
VKGRFPLPARSRRIVQCALVALAALGLRTLLTPENLTAVEQSASSGSGSNPEKSLKQPIRISGDIAHQWRTPDGTNVAVIRGNGRIEQGESVLTARQLVIWQSQHQGRERIEIYLEDDVHIIRPGMTRPQTSYRLAGRESMPSRFVIRCLSELPSGGGRRAARCGRLSISNCRRPATTTPVGGWKILPARSDASAFTRGPASRSR